MPFLEVQKDKQTVPSGSKLEGQVIPEPVQDQTLQNMNSLPENVNQNFVKETFRYVNVPEENSDVNTSESFTHDIASFNNTNMQNKKIKKKKSRKHTKSNSQTNIDNKLKFS